jgi:rod shape determining protein RodA
MLRRFFTVPIDWFVLILPLIITSLGVITIYTITFHEHGWRLAADQIIFAVIGIAAMLFFTFFDYRFFKTYAWPLYGLGILLLLPLLPFLAPQLPFVIKIFGAYRWLDFGFFQLQPSEIFKLASAIAAAKYLGDRIGELTWQRVLSFVVLAGIPFGLVLIQPDLGTAGVLFMVFAAAFLAAKPPVRAVFLAIAVLLVVIPVTFSNLKPYQKNRLETFLNPASDPLGQGYNVRQSKIAVGSGGLYGRGFGQGSQTVLNFLPVAHADFIFAGFAEATGFTGSIVVISLYVLLIFRMIGIARDSVDPFGQILVIAMAVKLFFQAGVHIGMNLGVLPVTGIPLPFMSYGGTALIIDLATMGIVQNIAIRHKKVVFS